jgi:AraC-like DNA-binding protein
MLHKDALIRLCKAREMLCKVGDDALSIPRIARACGMSTFHFIRLFKSVLGETPHQVRINARLEKARYLLTTTELSVTDICMEIGFSSLGTFSDLFARRVGLSPSAWRRKVKSMQCAPGQVPAQLIPGCFTLMAAGPVQKSNFQEALSRGL